MGWKVDNFVNAGCNRGCESNNPDSKVHGANMEPTWVLSAPDGPHAGPTNLAIREPSLLLWWQNCHQRNLKIQWRWSDNDVDYLA